MGYTTATAMLTHFKHIMALRNLTSLLQMSMDGPNVNLKFYYSLFQECKGEEFPDLLNIFSSFSNIY